MDGELFLVDGDTLHGDVVEVVVAMIGVLAPYREISDMAADLQREIDEPLEIVPARVTDALDLSHQLVRSGATVIVSRGGIADQLRASDAEWLVGVPIVDIIVTAYDVMRAVGEARKKAEWVSVIAFSNMIEGVQSVVDLLGPKILINPLGAQANMHKMMKSQSAGRDICFVGGATTCEIAEACRFQSVLIRSDKQSVAHAMREASRIAQAQQLEAKKRYRLRAVLDSMEDGFIVTDSAGAPELWNAKAAELIQVDSASGGSNLSLGELDEPIAKALRTGSEEDTVIRLPSGAQVVASVGPVSADRSDRGLLISLRDAVRVEALEHKVRGNLHSLGLIAKKRFSDVIGKSEIRQRSVSMAESFSRVDATVLILGESGTGKEVYAQSIHNSSSRRNGPYVALNCAALPESLLESELFGYAAGAFTGAAKEGKPGLFEMAHKGTILLDEVSELSWNLQGKLLRVLQERQIRRVGGERFIPIDVRIIAASNRDIVGMVRRGEFREDLFFRLDVLRLSIPPVRACPDDVEALFNHFVVTFSREMGLSPLKVTPEAAKVLKDYSWPGNVREIQNVVQRCLALYADKELTRDRIDGVLGLDRGLPSHHKIEGGPQASQEAGRLVDARKNATSRDIEAALAEAGGSITKAARLLGIHRTTLWRRLKAL